MKESYKDEVKALQRAAGIVLSEEMAGYEAGVEMEEKKERPMYGVENLDSAINNLKLAQDSMNQLIQDQQFRGKHKQKLQVLSQELNNIQGALSNLASGNVKKKEKVLKP